MDQEDPDSDLDHPQNLIISSIYFFGHILKIFSKSVHRLFELSCSQTKKQTDRQVVPGENITSLKEVKIPRGYCIHLTNLKRIRPMVTEL